MNAFNSTVRIAVFALGVALLGGCASDCCRCAHPAAPTTDLSPNKTTVEKYMEGFRRSDHAMILSCLTNDIDWEMPGGFHLAGKAAFDKEIENPAFVGRPSIAVSRLTEERDTVVAEGSLQCRRQDGSVLKAVFCDVFTMRNARIHKLVSYLVEVK